MGLLDLLSDKLQSGFIEANDRAKRFLTDLTAKPKQVTPNRLLWALNRTGTSPQQDFPRRVQDLERSTGRMSTFREDQAVPQNVRQTIPEFHQTGNLPTAEEAARYESLRVVEPAQAAPTPRPSVQGIRSLIQGPKVVQSNPQLQNTIPMQNNNPFNIKVGGSNFARDNTAGVDNYNHLRFKDFKTGVKAGAIDIFLKLKGQSRHPALQKPGATLTDLNSVYATDPNWKNNVASIASRLMGAPVDITTPVKNIPPSILVEAIGIAEGGLKGFNPQELENIRGIIDETIKSLQ